MKEFPFAKYYDDGTIEIFGNKEGLPAISGTIPAPDINTPSEEERQKRFDQVCANITLQGYFFTKKQRIRNIAFDKPSQKTTLSVRYRACKNEKEIKEVHDLIVEILKSGILKEAES
ncbi:MAG: hypothetical protein WC998_08705 [Candidatus Paceibacterota bacterium]|jgi:hypothetical protein